MTFIEVYTMDHCYESIRTDLIESIATEDKTRPHDHGSVTLTSGRRVYFGQVGTAAKLLSALMKVQSNAAVK